MVGRGKLSCVPGRLLMEGGGVSGPHSGTFLAEAGLGSSRDGSKTTRKSTGQRGAWHREAAPQPFPKCSGSPPGWQRLAASCHPTAHNEHMDLAVSRHIASCPSGMGGVPGYPGRAGLAGGGALLGPETLEGRRGPRPWVTLWPRPAMGQVGKLQVGCFICTLQISSEGLRHLPMNTQPTGRRAQKA